MTASMEDALAAITEARASYKDYVAQVEEDLKRERQVRLAKAQGTIIHRVAEAYALGANIADLKRAYGTKDYRTIRDILDAYHADLEDATVREQVAHEVFDWFTIETLPTLTTDGFVRAEDSTEYNVFYLDDGKDLMAVSVTGIDTKAIDGEVESSTENPDATQLFAFIRKASQ